MEPYLIKTAGVFCHLNYAGDKGRQITVQVSLGKKHETLSEK
jgi:hypothetical protein